MSPPADWGADSCGDDDVLCSGATAVHSRRGDKGPSQLADQANTLQSGVAYRYMFFSIFIVIGADNIHVLVIISSTPPAPYSRPGSNQ